MDEAQILCDRVAIVDHGKVIALGTPRELIASLGAQHVVEFAVPEGFSLTADGLGALPGVVSARQEEGHWRLQAAELHRGAALLDLLNARGALTELPPTPRPRGRLRVADGTASPRWLTAARFTTAALQHPGPPRVPPRAAMFWTFIFRSCSRQGSGLPKQATRYRQARRPQGRAGRWRHRSRPTAGRWPAGDSAAAQRLGPADRGAGSPGRAVTLLRRHPADAGRRALADDILQRAAKTDQSPSPGDGQARLRPIDFWSGSRHEPDERHLGIGFAIVDQRRKALKRLVATPMSRAHYLMSFVLSRFGYLVLEVAILVGFGVLVFGVPLRGSLGTLVLGSVLAGLMFGGVGLLIASRAKTIEGASGLMNLAMVPMWVFSGVFFNAANFPQAIQPFVQALPLTAAVDALRATMLEGATLSQLAPEFGIMAAWMIGTFGLALRIFRWL
jgi:hypothetical protein